MTNKERWLFRQKWKMIEVEEAYGAVMTQLQLKKT